MLSLWYALDLGKVAYVLGQLQNKTASDALSMILKDINVHPMVKHEVTEALGSIADDQCVALEEFAKDPEPIVSESCEVALSMLKLRDQENHSRHLKLRKFHHKPGTLYQLVLSSSNR
ncbi:hypothetical protein Vadar_018668 [Vaccinium darrowii]|uniref:Uncharacterized protein n=1 Tax=Vaccinium darrowii TaxID=229202 RepID=A0ACB7Z4Q3_9ERIC|nr:hypothetical protein Vadar_018668 [Vaccinium darrowii]